MHQSEQPARVLLRDIAGSDLAMDLPKEWNNRELHEPLQASGNTD
jgi:hypothetical protein